MSGVIYIIRTLHNNKVYVGSTKNYNKRVKQHLKQLCDNKHHNTYLQNVWNKYGDGDFIFSILEHITNIDELAYAEDYYIACNVSGYNIAKATGGDNFTNNPRKEEIRKNIALGVQKYMSTLTTEEKAIKFGRAGAQNGNWKGGTSQKLCQVCYKTKISPNNETCIACRDRSGVNNPFFGKKHSDSTKQVLREKNIGKKHTEATKTKLTGEQSSRFIGYYHTPWGIFPSSSMAQKNHEYMLSATIHRWCKQCDKEIKTLGRSKYLRELKENPIGKTYRAIGFWFQVK